MKTLFTVLAVLAGLFFFSTFIASCKKTDVSALSPKEDLVLGKWGINRMQLRLYYGGVFLKDTIIKQTPHPQNFVTFYGENNFEYKFNTTTSDIGIYTLSGADSLIANVGNKIYRWRMLTLTNELFTVVNTTTSDPRFPGAVVETYQTFVR